MKLIVDTYDRAVIPNIVDNTLFYDRKVQCKSLPKEQTTNTKSHSSNTHRSAFSQVQTRYARMKYVRADFVEFASKKTTACATRKLEGTGLVPVKSRMNPSFWAVLGRPFFDYFLTENEEYG